MKKQKTYTEEEVEDMLFSLQKESNNSDDGTYNYNNPSDPIYEDGEFIYGQPLAEGDNSRWELDPRETIHNISMALRRMVPDKNGIPKRHKKIPPLMSEDGIYDIQTTLQSFLNKNIAMGNITSSEVLDITKDIIFTIINLIENNYEKYKLEKSYFSYVRTVIETQVRMHLTRAISEGERKYRRDKHKITESYSHDEVRPDEISTIRA